MAKTAPLSADDLAPSVSPPRSEPVAEPQQPTPRPRNKGTPTPAKRKPVPSDNLVPMQFRMPRDFVRQFKRAAIDRDMKLNQLLEAAFTAFKKSGKGEK